jgi:hypothetical protein
MAIQNASAAMRKSGERQYATAMIEGIENREMREGRERERE